MTTENKLLRPQAVEDALKHMKGMADSGYTNQKSFCDYMDHLEARVAEISAQLEVAKNALEFYAREKLYTWTWDGNNESIEPPASRVDKGKKARKALEVIASNTQRKG